LANSSDFVYPLHAKRPNPLSKGTAQGDKIRTQMNADKRRFSLILFGLSAFIGVYPRPDFLA
jgi:hypothetical protein